MQQLDRGSFVKVFTMNTSCCSITRVEMRGIVEGLKLSWSLRIRKIRVQSDSATAIAILSKGSLLDNQHAILVMQYQDHCNRQWEVTLNHIYREANCVLRIIRPTLIILLCLVFIYLIRLIGVCPTDLVMTLLVSHFLGMLLF
ncbi:Putative ribonuclease H protein At1g65750 [Linum grandiflorum]